MIFREQPESDAFWRRAGPVAPLFVHKAGAYGHCTDAG